MRICNYNVIPRRNFDGSMTVLIELDSNKTTSFNYTAYEAQNMTLDKLEKKVSNHLVKEGISSGRNVGKA